MRVIMFLVLCVTASLAQAQQYAAAEMRLQTLPLQQLQFNGLGLVDPYAAGDVEDRRLADALAARLMMRQAQVLQLQAQAAALSASNVQLREYVCTRLCAPVTTNPAALQLQAVPQLPGPVGYGNGSAIGLQGAMVNPVSTCGQQSMLRYPW